MTLVRWDPFRNVTELQEKINRAFDDAYSRSREGQDDLSVCDWRPAVDIYETQNAIVIKAEIPGVRREDVAVELKDNILTLKGQRATEKDVQQEKFYRKERSCGTFHRSFTLPVTVHRDEIKAKFKDGILKVEILKPEEEKPKQIAVEIE